MDDDTHSLEYGRRIYVAACCRRVTMAFLVLRAFMHKLGRHELYYLVIPVLASGYATLERQCQLRLAKMN